MRRIGIFVFFDANGIVDRYIPYMLEDLMKNLERLVVVVNGKITDEGKEIAETIYERHELISDILVRLGVDKEIASEDACRIEHVISKESFKAVRDYAKDKILK